MIRQSHLIEVVGAFLMGCAVLLLVGGCAGARSQAPQKEEQGHTKATASEEARCEGTRTIEKSRVVYTTNDLPGCPKGGLLSGTNGKDNLYGGEGDDEIRGLGARDEILGGGGHDVIYGGNGDDDALMDGSGDDVIYGGDGNEDVLDGSGDDVFYGGDGGDTFEEGPGANVFYGGDGNDFVWEGPKDSQVDKFYCGKGKDRYAPGPEQATAVAASAPPDAEKKSTYVDHMDSCEKPTKLRVIQ